MQHAVSLVSLVSLVGVPQAEASTFPKRRASSQQPAAISVRSDRILALPLQGLQ